MEPVDGRKASNTDPEDFFGFGLALSADGNTLAVGAADEDGGATGIDGNQADNSRQEAGAVYVYVRDPMTLEWSPQSTYVKASNTSSYTGFGAAMALSADGNVLAIGSGDPSTAVGINGDQFNADSMGAGAVYVYRRDAMTLAWETDPAYVKASNTQPEIIDYIPTLATGLMTTSVVTRSR